MPHARPASRIALLLSLMLLVLLLSPPEAGAQSGVQIFLPLIQNVGPIKAPLLKWSRGGCQDTWCRSGWYASPAVADLDNDGNPEVIWTDYRLVVVNGEDGSDQWIDPNPGGGRGWPAPVVADLDGGGGLEIVSAHGGGWVTVHNANGSVAAGWPRQLPPNSEIRSLAAGDVDDAGGDLEILVCSTASENQWFLLDHNGNTLPGWPVHSPDSEGNGYAAGCFNQNVGLADLDGDGDLEMIGPNDTHYVVGYQHSGDPLRANALYGQVGGLDKPWARVGFHYDHNVDLRGYANCSAGQPPLEPRPNFADSAPALVDVDGNGTTEIIIVGNQYDCRQSPYQSLFQMPYILNPDRTRWSNGDFDWTSLPAPDGASAPLAENYNTIETVQPNPVVADLDGDGLKEILFASYDGRLHAYWLDKTEHGAWPYAITRPGEGFIRFASEPAVADLNNDGRAEVIIATWTQKGSNARGELIILNSLGNELQRVVLPASGDDWDGVLGAPTVANIDSDPDLEVVLGSAHMGLLAYDLPGTGMAAVLWGTGRGSYLRAGGP